MKAFPIVFALLLVGCAETTPPAHVALQNERRYFLPPESSPATQTPEEVQVIGGKGKGLGDVATTTRVAQPLPVFTPARGGGVVMPPHPPPRNGGGGNRPGHV